MLEGGGEIICEKREKENISSNFRKKNRMRKRRKGEREKDREREKRKGREGNGCIYYGYDS